MNASMNLPRIRAAVPARDGVSDLVTPRHRVYPPASAWAPDFDLSHWFAALDQLAGLADDAVAVEIHLPFCASRCLYCGCDVTVTHDDAEIDRYLDALQREMDLVTSRLGTRREVTRLHVAGGTPNHLSDAQLWRLMEILHRRFSIVPESSLSIECDPRRASASQLATLHAMGFRHVMFGMADLLPEVQAAVGRLQSAGLMRDAMAMARQARFESVQVDLLCGLPLQTPAGLDATLDRLLRLGADRVACLRYEHQPSRFWNQCAIAREALPAESLCSTLWRRAADRLTAAGYEWIGCDLFVLEGDELALARERRELRCNRLGYAALPADHVLAFGCGRISDVADTLVASESNAQVWQEHLARGRWPLVRGCRRSDEHRRRRQAMSRLLCDLELDRDAAAVALGADAGRLAVVAELGWMEARGDRLVVTRDGRYQLEGLCGIFGDVSPAVGRLH